MAVKRRNLYLYLALVCFIGIILIFIFDGYMGVYDKLVMDDGQYPQTVEADQWAQPERYGYLASMSVERGGKIDFTYTVENNRFSEYTAAVDVSLLYNQEKLADLASGTLSAGSFDSDEIKWTLDTAALVPADYPAEQSYFVDVIIKRGEMERRIQVSIYPSTYQPKPIILSPPR
jgi:hypothetical protein